VLPRPGDLPGHLPQYAGIGRIVSVRYYQIARDEGISAASLGQLLEDVL
jgi:hypothetical protein